MEIDKCDGKAGVQLKCNTEKHIEGEQWVALVIATRRIKNIRKDKDAARVVVTKMR